MRTGLRIFIATTALLVLSGVASAIAVYKLVARYGDLSVSQRVEQLTAESATIRNGPGTDSEKLDALLSRVVAAGGEYARTQVMKKDLLVETVITYLGFLAAEIAVAAVLSYLSARAVTHSLSVILQAIRTRRTGEKGYRLPELRGVEARTLGRAYNELLDAIDDQEALLSEQQRLAGWREVASFLAHQLKNPIAVVSLASQNARLLLESEDADENQARTTFSESIAIIDSESRRLSELVARFREVAAFPKLKLERAKISDVIDTASRGFAPDDVRFHIDTGSDPEINIDSALVAEALANLFQNSLEAGDCPVEIYLTVDDSPRGGVLVSIRDSITDVSPEIAGRVLKEVFSTKTGGSGLGLVFVRKVMSLHGGNVRATIGDTRGLEFALEFPPCR